MRWLDVSIDRNQMSDSLRNSTGSIGTVCEISGYRDEIEKLIGARRLLSRSRQTRRSKTPPHSRWRSHLEEFLVKNWAQTELGKEYVIYEEDGRASRQQHPTDTGLFDILAISKDKKTLLVIELKKGRASGRSYRPDAPVHGICPGGTRRDRPIRQRWSNNALEDDQRIRRALGDVIPLIDFYRYQISFKLIKRIATMMSMPVFGILHSTNG